MGRHEGDGSAQVLVDQQLGALFLTPEELRDLCVGGRPKLTPRQMLTLRGLIAGLREPEIAAILGRTPRAVKAHIHGIYQRYNCGPNPRPHQVVAKAWELVEQGRARRAGGGKG